MSAWVADAMDTRHVATVSHAAGALNVASVVERAHVGCYYLLSGVGGFQCCSADRALLSFCLCGPGFVLQARAVPFQFPWLLRAAPVYSCHTRRPAFASAVVAVRVLGCLCTSWSAFLAGFAKVSRRCAANGRDVQARQAVRLQARTCGLWLVRVQDFQLGTINRGTLGWIGALSSMLLPLVVVVVV